MYNDFQDKFTIKIDTSKCKSIISDYSIKLDDTWHYSDQILESGKIYGLVSEYGHGCTYLSYLLGGKIKFKEVKILYNNVSIQQNELSNIAWNLEPYSEHYGAKQVRKSIEKALINNPNKEDFETIAEKFILTPERYDRKFRHLSSERWRAASAFGYAQNKKIYFAPYKTSEFYYRMCQSCLLKALRELTKHGALVVLPAGSDEFIKHIADEIIYINRRYDIESLNAFYNQLFNEKWIH